MEKKVLTRGIERKAKEDMMENGDKIHVREKWDKKREKGDETRGSMGKERW